MPSLLNKIIDVLPEAQQRAVKVLLEKKRKNGEIRSLRERQESAATTYNRIKANLGRLILNPRFAFPGEKISSDDYNKNMEEIFLDLNALYDNIDQLAKTIIQQGVTINSEYIKSRAAVQKLINDVRVFSFRKKYPEFNEVKFIDFNTSKNTSAKFPKAEINSNTRLLQLKPLDSSRIHLTNRTARATTIYTKTYSQGIKGTLSKDFPPEKMVDQRPETFWGNLVMSDAPVSQIYEVSSRSGTSSRIAVEGPITEIFFRFSHAEKINTIKLIPFAEYPIKIIDVAYRPTASSQILYTIDDFTSSSTLDWEEYNFSPVFATEVKITIAQENYKKVNYFLPKRTVVSTDLFQRIFEKRANDISNGAVVDSDNTISFLKTVDSYQLAISSLEELLSNSDLDITLQTDIEYYDDFLQLLEEVYSDLDPEKAKALVERLTSVEVFQQEDQEDLIEISKYEYILGIREVEIGYQVYAPTSYYASEQFTTQATVSQIQIEVSDRHVPFKTQWEDRYQKTSIEWDIDLGDGRRLPIHPRNIVDDIDLIPAAKDERLEFDLSSKVAFTRHGGYYATAYRLKKEGVLIPTEAYTTVKTTGAVPRLRVELIDDAWYNESSIYTIDYAVDVSSYDLDILGRFQSKPLDNPEIYTETGPDNDITLEKYPYINYEVVNLTGAFEKSATESIWTFTTPQENAVTGQITIFPTILDDVGNIIQTGSITGQTVEGVWGPQSGLGPLALSTNVDLSPAYFGEINGISYGYFLRVMDNSILTEIESFSDVNEFLLKTPAQVTVSDLKRWDSLSTGDVFGGDLSSLATTTGNLTVNYVIGVGVKTDDQLFAISDVTYRPMTITIGGQEAKNITNYETLRHPAFSIANNTDSDYEYIQAGKKVYFNQPVNNQEIKVDYRWITEYVQLLATLKCNKSINPDLTPKVNDVKILINNLVI